MHKEFHVGPFGWGLTFGRYQQVRGICSNVGEDGHFLMWDFDECERGRIWKSLQTVQEMYQLPTIYVVQTHAQGRYHAYCFDVHSFAGAAEILATTEGVDIPFVAIGMLRGYWTLRITPKVLSFPRGRGFEHAGKLLSPYAETVDWQDCKTEVRYWTRRD